MLRSLPNLNNLDFHQVELSTKLQLSLTLHSGQVWTGFIRNTSS